MCHVEGIFVEHREGLPGRKESGVGSFFIGIENRLRREAAGREWKAYARKGKKIAAVDARSVSEADDEKHTSGGVTTAVKKKVASVVASHAMSHGLEKKPLPASPRFLQASLPSARSKSQRHEAHFRSSPTSAQMNP